MKSLGKLALISVSMLAISTPVVAQDAAGEAEAAETYAGNEIIVQARRKGEDIQDVPLVVQAVSSAELQKLEIRQFEDVTKAVPGLQLVANPNGFGTTASMRGVNFDANASGASTTVEFYRNDAVITSSALFQALYDVGQIEVLRGPQGTLRGRASPSGSITLTTRRPELSEVGGYVSGSASDQGRWNINGAFNVPVIADKLGVRVAGFTGRSEGNGINGLNVRTGAFDDDIFDNTDALRASVRADPFDGILLLDFNYETISRRNRQYDQVMSGSLVDSDFALSPVTIRAKDRVGVTQVPRTTDARFQIYNWQAQLNLWGQQLTYVGSKVSSDIATAEPRDFAALFTSVVAVNPPHREQIQYTTNQTDQTTHELRLQNQERVLGMFDYVIGGLKMKSNSPTLFNNITAVASRDTLYSVSYAGIQRYRADEENSLFGNITAHIGDRLEVSGGIRRIWFKANSGVLAGAWGAPVSGYQPSPGSNRCYGHSDIAGCQPTKKATIYSAAVKYNVTDNAMVYGSYGTSWRPGNSVVGFRGPSGVFAGSFIDQFLNLPDERSKSFEIGLKTRWLDDRLTFNISGYSQKYTNYAFRVSTPVSALAYPEEPARIADPFNFVAPVPAKVKGFEAELNFNVSPNFQIGTTVAFADGKIKNGLFPCTQYDVNGNPLGAQALWNLVGANQVATCRGDTSPASSSRWSGNVNAEYSMPVVEGAEGYLRGFLNWKGYNRGFGLNPYDQVKAYGLLDLFAGLRADDGAWDLTLFVKNALNTRRVTTRTDGGLITSLRADQNLVPLGGTGTSIGSTNATNYFGITTNSPREFGVNFRVAFGSR